MNRVAASLLLAASVLLAPGCTTLRESPSTRLPEPPVHLDATKLGRAVAARSSSHPGMSGWGVLSYGQEALVARMALVDAAERTIDAQYYIYASDAAGSLLLRHLIAAANRGVRVRLLLDDYNVGNDAELAALCSHPNLEIRVFNPVSFRAKWARIPEYVLSFGSADRRMHNKLLIADNAFAILGGRNIGDDYFNIGTENTFRDFDIIAAGPATAAATTAFDEYWNSPWSVSATALVFAKPNRADLAAILQKIDRRALAAAAFEAQYGTLRGRYLAGLLQDGTSLVWAPGQIISDPPSKKSGRPEDLVAERLDEQWTEARREVLIESSYLVPGKTGIVTFRALTQRGVSVKVLTCALSTTDVPLVYCAYELYRKPLLESGVELHEYRLSPPTATRTRRPWYRAARSYAILHSKAMVFDRRRVWIGSLNLDPRSTRLNTEIAAIIDSRELADRLARDFEADMAPNRSWKLGLDAKGRIYWAGTLNGVPTIHTHQPADLLRRLDTFLLSVFPRLEDQL